MSWMKPVNASSAIWDRLFGAMSELVDRALTVTIHRVISVMSEPPFSVTSSSRVHVASSGKTQLLGLRVAVNGHGISRGKG
jgi:hypothetical protein